MAVPFTWNPSAAIAGTDGSFTSDNITVQDYATVNVTAGATGSPATFTENGLINLSTFNSGGSPVTLPGLGTNYAIYAQFSAAGTQSAATVTPAPGTSITGAFNSLNYTLFAASGKPTFTSTAGGASVSGLTGQVTLANGSLISGTAALTNDPIAGLSASATTVNTLNVVDPAFFVAPAPSTFTLGLNVAFTNTGSVLSTSGSNELVINGGGGNATVTASSAPPPSVPEPASFAVLGAGLIALTMARRQRLI